MTDSPAARPKRKKKKPSDVRLVAMTQEQRDWIALLLPGMSFNQHIPQAILAAWDAAEGAS